MVAVMRAGCVTRGTVALLAASLLAAAVGADDEIVTGITFVPGTYSSADPKESKVVLRGPFLLFNDASGEPLKRTSRTGGVLAPLVKSLGTPRSAVLRGDQVFASSGCTIFKASLDGLAATVLATTSQCEPEVNIAVDDTNVYFATFVASPDTWTIHKVPVIGGAVTPLVSTGKQLRSLASDGADLYWQEQRYPDPGGPQSSVRKIPVGGGSPVDIATGLKAFRGGLALSATDVFFADTDFSNYRLMKAPLGGGSPTVLAGVASLDPPTDLALHDSKLYYATKGALKAVPIAGGVVETLISGLDSPTSLVIRSGDVFWTETVCCAVRGNGMVRKASLAGGPLTTLAQGRDWPGDVAADASHLYWAEGGTYGPIEGYGGIFKLAVGGGAPVSVADSGAGILPHFAADDTHAYFANRWTVKKVPLDGGPVERLAVAAFSIQDIATDGTHVYWIEGPGSTIKRVPVNGGTVSVVANGGSGPPGPLALDGTHVYWIDHGDAIKKALKSGGPAMTLASGLPFLSDLAVDGTDVFFSEQDTGRVRKMSVGGGAITTLMTLGSFSWIVLALDQQDLLAVDQGAVWTVPKAGGTSIAIATGLLSHALFPNGLAVDDRGLCWTETAGGTVNASFATPPVTAVSFATPASTAAEAGGTAQARAHLTTSDGQPLASPASVHFDTVNGSALTGQDYTASSGTLSFPAGTPSGTILSASIGILDDAVYEGSESFSVALSNAVGAALEAPATLSVVILEDDPMPTLAIDDASVREGNSGSTSASFSVTLSVAAGVQVTVDYATQDVTALSGSDYAPASGMLTFLPGETTKPVAVSVTGDTLNERPETFEVRLSGASGAEVADGTGVGAIRDDEDEIVQFDADTLSDLTLFHEATGLWFMRNSTNGAVGHVGYGGADYTRVPGDYDGDGITDVAVYHPPSGLWFVRSSTTMTTTSTGFGGSDYKPVRGDFDGDGKTDLAVFHDPTGLWFIKNSSTGTVSTIGYGATGHVPVPGDYDGDGTTDLGVYHPPTGLWFTRASSTLTTTTTGFGGSAYTPVRGDFDGDGKTDLAVFHAGTGLWYIRNSATSTVEAIGYGGGGGYTPVPGKYDADGRTDLAVYHEGSGLWFLRSSLGGGTTTIGFGGTGYSPVN